MSRAARAKSSTGIYHVMLRGINRQIIFWDEEDNEKFIQILTECKKISGFELYGYCLMGNHIHLLMKEENEKLDQIFKRIGTRYVYWYNWKYKRSGHLFQDRFKSEAVDDDAYFITALRYIHQNPLKAGLCANLIDYKWSSYGDYFCEDTLSDTGFAMELIGRDDFERYMNEPNEDKALEIEEEKKRLTDAELTDKILGELEIISVMIQNQSKESQLHLIKEILKFEGVSARQVSRVTGISANIIWKIAKE